MPMSHTPAIFSSFTGLKRLWQEVKSDMADCYIFATESDIYRYIFFFQSYLISLESSLI